MGGVTDYYKQENCCLTHLPEDLFITLMEHIKLEGFSKLIITCKYYYYELLAQVS